MIQPGTWKGYYKYNDPQLQKAIGSDSTEFRLEILTVADQKFSGEVEDDLVTGGTEGIGKIEGTIDGNKITFVKRMPVMTILLDKKGSRKTWQKKHKPIYYSGTIANDKLTMSGTWKFKIGLLWIGFLPIPVLPAQGTWSAEFCHQAV